MTLTLAYCTLQRKDFNLPNEETKKSQEASLDLLTASSEFRFSCFQPVGSFQPLIDAFEILDISRKCIFSH